MVGSPAKLSEVPPLLKQRLSERSIWAATSTNGGWGFMIGSVLLAMEWNKSRRSKNEKAEQKFRQEWKSILLKAPVFISIFTAMFKGGCYIGRILVGLKGVAADGSRNKRRRTMIMLWAFLSGFTAQRMSPLLNWSWALYAMIRSLLGFVRINLHPKLMPESFLVYGLVHGTLPYFICFNIKYLQSAYKSFFRAVLGENEVSWAYYLGHNHTTLPPSHLVFHPEEKNSAVALPKLYVSQLRKCMIFYLKFYLLTSVFSLHKLNSVPKMKKKAINVIKQTVQSSMFFHNSFFLPARSHSLYLQHIPPLKYNRMALLVTSWIIGTMVIQFEPSASRRTDITIFSMWKVIEQACLMGAGIDGEHDSRYHPVLGSNTLPCILFGMACSINILVRSTNPKALKSLESSIFNFLVG